MSEALRCVIVDDEPVAREILESFVMKTSSLELVATCKNAIEAIEIQSKQTVDLFFLDINMPEVNGLSLAKIVGKNAHVIFTTAYRDYAVDGFNLNVVDYLLKPIAFDRFLEAVQKIPNQKTDSSSNEKEQSNSDFMFVRSDRKMIKVDFENILYIESVGDYVKIHLKDNSILTRETMSNLLEMLSETHFLRIHRSFVIAIDKINSYTNEFVEVNKQALPISRTYKESVLQKLASV